MEVYHIVKNELDFAVSNFIQPKTYSLCDFDLKKRQVEEELENVRKERFPDFHMDDVEFWTIQKSSIYGRKFKVLTLETTEPVFWFSAESYNMYFNGQRNDLHQACVEFWKSNRNTEIDKLIDCEGITNGPAQIIAIQQVCFSRENGLKVM